MSETSSADVFDYKLIIQLLEKSVLFACDVFWKYLFFENYSSQKISWNRHTGCRKQSMLRLVAVAGSEQNRTKKELLQQAFAYTAKQQ